LGSKALTVNNAAPSLALSGNAATNEGAAYVLHIEGSDAAGGADPLSYDIDWGDGGGVQNLTAAQLAALSGNVGHVFADGNANRTISVTVNDGDGGSTNQTLDVAVSNVAPTLVVSGAANGQVGQNYALNLGAITDPGTDTVVSYQINWGDGNSETVLSGGNVNHVYGGVGNYAIQVGLTDEDGSHANAGSLNVEIDPSLVRIGQAPDRQTGTGGQWAAAWNHADVTVVHKANATSVLEDWTTVRFSGLSPQLLSGGDIYSGDLGVSGQSLATSSVRQEIDGREVLRFNLDGEADAVTVNLSRFFIQDDGSLFAEAGRLRLLDANGAVVGEAVFHANAASGNKQVTLTGQEHFVAVELNAGVYDGSDFVFGGYANANGSFATGPTTDALGGRHGSDFLVDSVEFNFVAVGVPQQDQNLI
ncbi:MAG: PKD domain-containing protein, partial [Dechloromonas sp.]|nr:PKD domain-containing protein [Dechloromonas sp.]